MTTFRVAVMGSENEQLSFGSDFGVHAFDLTTEQICTLLQDVGTIGVDTVELGVPPVMTYKVYPGGRYSSSISREEISQTMQGFQIFIAVIPEIPYTDSIPAIFLQSITEENLLEKCQFVIARVVSTPKLREDMGEYAPKKKSTEKHVREYGLDPMLYQKNAKKGNGELQGIERDIASLRLILAGQEVRETVVQPVKETVTAGKSLLGLGQRLIGWITAGREVAASAA